MQWMPETMASRIACNRRHFASSTLSDRISRNNPEAIALPESL
jgi:hypothetical protein